MKILFIGNSHTYFNDMPALVRSFFEAGGMDCEVVMLAYSGRDLKWHRQEYFSERFNILYGNYDYVVLQQATHPFPPKEELLEYGQFFIDLCRKAGSTPILYLTWAEKRFPENQQKLNDAFYALHEGNPETLLAPVGPLFETINQKHPEIDLFYRDGEHASVIGDYLIALTLYAVISGDRELKNTVTALNFRIPADIRFECPSVSEDISAIPEAISPEILSVIHEEVRTFLSQK